MKYDHPLDEADALIDQPIGKLIERFGSLEAATDYVLARLDEAAGIEAARTASIEARAKYEAELARYRSRTS